jgi:DDE family transposase
VNLMNNRQLYQWVRQVSKDWSGVTRHFRESVVVFSRGVARAQSSQVRKIAGCAGGKADSQRRRLQRFLAHEGSLAPFFKHWTASVVRVLKLKAVVLIVDETKRKDQLGVMVVGLAYDKRCIPLAWRVYRANDAGAYPAEGQARLIIRLLKQVQAGLPTDLPVRVLTDRGIGTSPLLMRGLIAMGWSFLFRVTKQSKIVLPDGQAVTFYDQVALPGQSYQATGLVFKKRGRIPAHVRVVWGQAAAAPWSLVTNDPSLFGWEYAQRMWIEAAFRDLKSYGWQLEQASLADPQRMARLWVFLVVAYSWMLCWGMALARAGCLASPKRRPDGSQVRAWSLFREGRQACLTAGLPAAFS